MKITKQSWEEEFREYFDKCLKPKKPTMKNLDREILIDFISKTIEKAVKEERERIKISLEIAMTDEGEYLQNNINEIINKIKNNE